MWLSRLGRREAVALACALLAMAASSAGLAQSGEYTLGSGDRVRVTVFGEENLSGEFEIGSSGTISMPLIGSVPASGKSVAELEEQIVSQLKPDYLKHPKVSVDVLNYRPFYIYGEIEAPGSYPYRAGMTVLNAVVMSGGYTYRADTDDITIRRKKNGSESMFEVTEETRVLPGDVVDIGMRFF